MSEPLRKAILRVLLPARQIPDGATVSKPTGQKKYALRRGLVIYAEEGANRKSTVSPAAGSVFLLTEFGGSISQHSDSSLLHWHTTLDGLIAHAAQEKWP
jgi:hypothetical protein